MSTTSRAGNRALLIDYGVDVAAADLHAAAAATRAIGGVIACIVGQQTLYVIFDREPRPDEITTASATAVHFSGRTHRIAVSFRAEDAPDLDEFLGVAGITKREFLRRLHDVRLTARYLGFRAGFAYLDGWPAEWAMPRRPTSRALVPRGSFAIAHRTAGFYPIDTPGGWNLLGRTDAVLWDPWRQPPNLIAAGDTILIDPHEDEITSAPPASDPPRAMDGVEVIANRQFATVVDMPDWRRIESGQSAGGPFDEQSAAAANRAVGNASDAPVLECAMTGPRLRFADSGVVAWCGADCDLPQLTTVTVERGQELAIGRIRNGLRGWFAYAPRSSHAQAGDPQRSDADRSNRLRIGVMPGPHDTPLRTIECEVTPQLNRVGIRLRPLQAIGFAPRADLPSCGMQFGTIQLHPDGSFVAMGPDHPITGGYLQPLTVMWDERWKLGQLSPGEHVLFESR